MSFLITHAAGTKTLASYTVPRHGGRNALTVTREAGGVIRRTGDGLPLPRDLQVSAWVPATSYATAFDAALDVVRAAETATSVAWHYGEFPVAALAEYHIEAEAEGASVTLTFLLAGGEPA